MWDRIGTRIVFDSTHQGWQVRWFKALGLKSIYNKVYFCTLCWTVWSYFGNTPREEIWISPVALTKFDKPSIDHICGHNESVASSSS